MTVNLYDAARANLAALETSAWPAARLGQLIDAHEAGRSFAVMGQAIRPKASKNACIGQAHRIGLPLRDPQKAYHHHLKHSPEMIRRRAEADARAAEKARARKQREADREAKSRARAEARRKLDAQREKTGAASPVALSARREATAAALALPPMSGPLISDLAATQCRFPLGDPKAADFGFCGRLKAGDGPYCPTHHDIAFNAAASEEARATAILRELAR